MAIKDSVLNVVIRAQDKASETLGRFKGKLDDTATSAKRAANDGIKDLDRRMDDVGDAATQADRKLDAAQGGIKDTGESSNKASYHLGKFRDRLHDTNKGADGRRIRTYSERVKESGAAAAKAGAGLKRLAVSIGATVAAYASFATIKTAVTAVLKTGDQFEKLSIQLETVEGSAEKAASALDFIKKTTADTPLQLAQVTEAYVKLKNFGLDPQSGALQAIIDQNAKLGGGYERLNGIILALGQAQAKQKLQGEEILQLVERGVPVWDLLAQATGRNVRELQEMSSAGELGTDVIAKLIDKIGEASQGAAAKSMTTLSGLVSNLKDQWQLFLNQVAQAGVLEVVKDELTGILEAGKRLASDGTLNQWARGAAAAFSYVCESGSGSSVGRHSACSSAVRNFPG